jgi:hypothetical protein
MLMVIVYVCCRLRKRGIGGIEGLLGSKAVAFVVSSDEGQLSYLYLPH